MKNQSQLKSSKEIITYLAEIFPQSFIVKGDAKPLKIGIFKDIISRLDSELAISNTQLRSALRVYTSSWRYLHSVKVGVQRIDLDGNPCGALEQEHVDFAQQKLKESKEKFNAAKMLQKNIATNDQERSQKEDEKKPLRKKSAHKVQPAYKVQNKTEQKTPMANIKDISELNIAQKVKVNLGNNLTDVTVTELMKESVKVQTASGLELTVRKEHIVI